MDIPIHLINEIKSGNVVLFLGAGASVGSKNKIGKSAPTGKNLGKIIATKFLGDEYQDATLQLIGELAINESSLGEVQDFIADIFEDLVPADFLRTIPKFKWYGIATTNYDLILERIYSSVDNKIQDLRPLISNNDLLDDIFRDSSNLPYLKLHGCISITHDDRIPLILTVDQYISHQTNRDRLFRTLYEWGYNHPILFIGHGLQDYDIRTILFELNKIDQYRPQFYLVTKSPTEEIKRLWASYRITVLSGTFEEFITEIDIKIPESRRSVTAKEKIKHPIEFKISSDVKISKSTIKDIDNNFDYVHPNIQYEPSSPHAFYRGFDLGWFPIINNLDVKRRLNEILQLEVVMLNEEERPSIVDLYVIKAEAGAGKTTFLKRLAWDASFDLDMMCLFHKGFGEINFETLYEIYRATRERIFLFLDNAADCVEEIDNVFTKAKSQKVPITIITAERVNEWNMGCQELEDYVSRTFQIRYLHIDEINELIDLLKKHDSLGHLDSLSRDEQINSFEKRAGRQLLVALHEVTAGKPFEEILVDEFNEIKPQKAQSLYLSVCILDRLNVPVRAGLISRSHGIAFTEFKDKLFSPLEHVVQVKENKIIRDFLYKARHPEIANIVFEQILRDPDDRYNEYVKLVSNLNLSYSSDKSGFMKLLRGKVLKELFPEHNKVLSLYEIAEALSPDNWPLIQQKAIYEMNRENGDYTEAYNLLKKAERLSKGNPAILHSLSELARLRADDSRSDLQRKNYLSESKKLSLEIIKDRRSGKYARHTYVKILLLELSELLKNQPNNEKDINKLISQIEKNIEEGLQQNPTDSYMLTSEADFRKIFHQDEKVINALKKAFNSNPGDIYIASRLSKTLSAKNEIDEACEILEKALETKRGDTQLNYQYAKLIMKRKEVPLDTLIYHLRRSFVKGDNKLDAQYLFARYAFESPDKEIRDFGDEVFKNLRQAPIPYEQRYEIRDIIKEEGLPALFFGTLIKKEQTFGFIRLDRFADTLYVYKNATTNDIWVELKIGDRCQFNIVFSFYGPRAMKLEQSNE